jgi:hypothetical protein
MLNEYVLKLLTRDGIATDGQRMIGADLFQRIMIRNTHSAKCGSIHKYRGRHEGIIRVCIYLCVQLPYTNPRSFPRKQTFQINKHTYYRYDYCFLISNMIRWGLYSPLTRFNKQLIRVNGIVYTKWSLICIEFK